MFKTVYQITRPSTEVEFFNMRDSLLISENSKDHLQNSYIITGKIVSFVNELSEDTLSMSSTTIWDSKNSYNEFNSDPIIVEGVINVREQYRTSNGIEAVLVFSGETKE